MPDFFFSKITEMAPEIFISYFASFPDSNDSLNLLTN